MLARRGPEAAALPGSADRQYDSVDQAVQRVRATLNWDDDQWKEESDLSIGRAFRNHALELSIRTILEEWLVLMGGAYIQSRAANILLSVRPSDVLLFCLGGRGAETLRSGFHGQETWGTWTGQRDASLAFSTAQANWDQVQALEIRVRGHVRAGQRLATRISINGKEIGVLEIEGETHTYNLGLSGLAIAPNKIIHIGIHTSRLSSPRERGIDDPRYLGVGMESLSFI